jgi:hypothetical protein
MSICFIGPIIAASLYPVIYISYRQVLAQKRLEISSVVTDDIAKLYRGVFGIPPDVLFKKSYSLTSYLFAVAMNSVFAFGLVFLAIERSGVNCLNSVDLQDAISKTPPAVIAALAGAFLWGLYDALRRYQSVNLTPESLHFMWLRVAIAGAISPFVAITFQGGVAALIGFGLGAFPLSTLSNFLQAQVTEKMKISLRPNPSETPTLQNIQGLTPSTLDTLAEIGLESTEHLAYADPLKLFLRTNLPWKVILDIVDQTLLFNYVGAKMEALRPFGIRGAIELSDVRHLIEEEGTRDQGIKLLSLIASTLRREVEGVWNLIRTVDEDYQVDLISELWGDAYSHRQDT